MKKLCSPIINSAPFLFLLPLLFAGQALAQVPLPGGSAGGQPVEPGLPAAAQTQTLPPTQPSHTVQTHSAAPTPGPAAQEVIGTSPAGYRRLPINYKTAAIRLEELRNVMLSAKAKDFQNAISDYLDWLSDLADGHWKLYQAFAKVDSLKAQAELEKSTTLKLGSLKRQALLLKAEFLVRNNRQPEALSPLIDIVTAEPKTATGEAAYNMLKEIGFSEEVPLSNAPAQVLPLLPKTITENRANVLPEPKQLAAGANKKI